MDSAKNVHMYKRPSRVEQDTRSISYLAANAHYRREDKVGRLTQGDFAAASLILFIGEGAERRSAACGYARNWEADEDVPEESQMRS